MEKIYNPSHYEEKWKEFWEKNRLSHPEAEKGREVYSIVIPPPNVTAVLHIGHGLNNTIQDILIRFYRMRGYLTEWMPGTDHAGIATQNVVERNIKRETGKTRQKLGREKFLEEMWHWKETHKGKIIEQLKRLGCSCDWERERFTMDEGLSRAVREAFVRLYERGLIYRGKYIINWCPRCQTALSNEETSHEDETGKLWHIHYPLKNSGESITAATTRPETMLGDTAVAVNPSDKRYQRFTGKTVILPLVGREIPVIADLYAKSEFGTGAVTVTPAHDPNDFELGNRHNLEKVVVIGPDGTMTPDAGKDFVGLDRFKCREKVVRMLEKQGLLGKVETHEHAVGHCYRCGTVIEPALSDQWFVSMKELAKPGIEAVKDGRICFHPQRWTEVYLNWMENIRDWCISRQLWWGHRIPVWYCNDCGEMTVSRTDPTECASCKSRNIRQDEDVLDTWFSSWLWPCSTFGWPDKTTELDVFYPTDTLVTAPEIIFFWVARMIMAGFEFMGQKPFSSVYLHGTVRDSTGRKMSKSLGNVIDPVEVITSHGADAFRFSIIVITAKGQDVYIQDNTFDVGRNFCNKLWNASRFVLSHLENFDGPASIDYKSLDLSDRWILSRFSGTLKTVASALQDFRFNEAAQTIYDFFWHDYCDWYLELVKPRLKGEKDSGDNVRSLIVLVLAGTLKILHPIMPFITEELWQRLKGKLGHETLSIMISDWPDSKEFPADKEAEKNMALTQGIITVIRNIRSEMNVPPGKQADVTIIPANNYDAAVLSKYSEYIKGLARIHELTIDINASKPKEAASGIHGVTEVYLHLKGLIDVEKERVRLSKEISRIKGFITATEKKLENEQFLANAPEKVIEKERAKLSSNKEGLEKIEENLAALSSEL